MDKILSDAGVDLVEEGYKAEGFSVKIVAPMRKVFDKKKYVELGGQLKLLDDATREEPSTSYVKITCPKSEKEDIEQPG